MKNYNDDANKGFNWNFMQGKFKDILGEDFWQDINNVLPRRGPSVDMYRTDNEIVVVAELPGGYSTGDINIRLRGLKLYISGNVPYNYPIPEDELLHKERFIGEFKREIQLPEDIIPNEVIDAKFKGGILEIHVPTLPASESKDIKIDFSD